MICGEKKEEKKNKDNQEIPVEYNITNFKQVTFKDSLNPIQNNNDEDNEISLTEESNIEKIIKFFNLLYRCLEIKYFSKINEKTTFLIISNIIIVLDIAAFFTSFRFIPVYKNLRNLILPILEEEKKLNKLNSKKFDYGSFLCNLSFF